MITVDYGTYQSLPIASAMKVIVDCRLTEFVNMTQIMNKPTAVAPARAIYDDAEFSDIEIDTLMQYFRVSTYQGLKSVLAAMKKSTQEF